MRFRQDESGQTIVLVVLCLAILLGFLAFALDVGQLLYVKRELQTAADAAASAGALEIQQCGSTLGCTAMQSAAQSAMTENRLSADTVLTQCTGSSGSGVTLELNNGPCALGASDPNNNNGNYVEAVVTKQQQTLFAGILGVTSVSLAARSEAGLGPPKFCIYVTDPSADQALLVNGNGSLIASCGINVDSNKSDALLVNGSGTLDASTIDVVGSDLLNGNPSVSPTPQTGQPFVADPLAGLPAPTVGGCTYSNYTVNSNTTATLSPGTYCGLQINGGATVTFSAGNYIMNGNVVINANSTVSGSGVFFYINSGQWIMNGNSHADLVADTSGTYSGILFFQKKTDTSQFILNGDSTSIWQGALYLPGGQLVVNGNGNLAAYTFIDVDTMIVNGSDSFTVGSDYSSLPNGPPIHGKSAHLME